jgi:hypothetical protein
MKIRKIGSGVWAVWLAFGFIGCSIEPTFLPDLNGNLVGYVVTCDEFANPLDDHSGVLVSTFGAVHNAQIHTDARGRFEFRNLPAGTYDLYLEKSGFGNMKQTGIQHLGGKPTILGLSFTGSNQDAFRLYQLPTTQITKLSVGNDSLSGEFVFTGDQPYDLTVMLFLSDESDFATGEAKKIATRYLSLINGAYQGRMYAGDLPFHPGETVYYRAAVVVGNDILYSSNNIAFIAPDTYINYNTGRIIYPNLGNESEQYSYVSP